MRPPPDYRLRGGQIEVWIRIRDYWQLVTVAVADSLQSYMGLSARGVAAYVMKISPREFRVYDSQLEDPDRQFTIVKFCQINAPPSGMENLYRSGRVFRRRKTRCDD